jgi:hypothetical protein
MIKGRTLTGRQGNAAGLNKTPKPLSQIKMNDVLNNSMGVRKTKSQKLEIEIPSSPSVRATCELAKRKGQTKLS